MATDTALGILWGRCNWRGGLEDGPIVELYQAPPWGCSLRAFRAEPEAATVGYEPRKERLL